MTETAHIVAYRRTFLGGHRALCGALMRQSTGIAPDAKACPQCLRIHERLIFGKEARR